MDISKLPQQPAQLLYDLESIRELLDDGSHKLLSLIDSLDPHNTTPQTQPVVTSLSLPTPNLVHTNVQPRLPDSAHQLQQLDGELRSTAQLILQDVIDDFMPQIKAELKRRLEERLPHVLPARKP